MRISFGSKVKLVGFFDAMEGEEDYGLYLGMIGVIGLPDEETKKGEVNVSFSSYGIAQTFNIPVTCLEREVVREDDEI